MKNKNRNFTFSDQSLKFDHLEVLNLWGGNLDQHCIFLRHFGAQLLQLKLVHVEQLTINCLIEQIFHISPNLQMLELQNCSIYDASNLSNFNLSSLKQLIIVSKCSENFVSNILKILAPTLEHLEFGTSAGISDFVVEKFIGKLQNLKVFKVAHSSSLSIKSVQLLLENCPKLQEISDLSAFSAIQQDELIALENHLIQANIDVKIS